MSMNWPPIFASSGFGIHVGQYTGAWMRLASCCQPCAHAAGQLLDVAAPAGTSATSAIAATTPTRVALMRDRVPPFRSVLDLGRWAADEGREVPRVNDHCIAAGVLELFDLVRRRQRQGRGWGPWRPEGPPTTDRA